MKDIIFLNTKIKMPLMSLPVCTPIVDIDGKKIVISPGSRIQDSQYDTSWNVTDIIAPNLFHYAGVTKASAKYPKATLWKCHSLQKKASDITWQKELGADPWPYQENLPLIALKGMPGLNEVVFVHKPSKSLIVTDFVFNMKNMTGLGPRLILSLFGTYNKFAISKLVMRTIKDKSAVEKSLAELFSYDFENIILSHGENIIGDGKGKLLAALRERQLQPI